MPRRSAVSAVSTTLLAPVSKTKRCSAPPFTAARTAKSPSEASILIWLAIGAVIVVGYTYRDDAQRVGANVVGALRPGTAVVGPGGEVTITRRSDGLARHDERLPPATGDEQQQQRGHRHDAGELIGIEPHHRAAVMVGDQDGERHARHDVGRARHSRDRPRRPDRQP
jgi:hypothetical protein